MTIKRIWHDGERVYREEIPTINITRKERAVAAYERTRQRTNEEIVAYTRGYEAAEWDFEMVAMNMGPNYGVRP